MLQKLIMDKFELNAKDAKKVIIVSPIATVATFGIIFGAATLAFLY